MSTPHARSGTRVTGSTSRRGRHAQRGQALIEFTFFFTFVMMPMVVGVTDISALLDDNVNIVYAARQGARTGAVIGPVAGADCEIVGTIYATLLNQPDVTLTQITIFQIQHDGTVTGNQEVYPAGDICTNTTFNSNPTTDTWQATSRNVTPFFEDSIGVRLDFTYSWRFNVLGFANFSGYDIAEFPMNPSGEPTPLPPATPTPGGPTPTPTACITFPLC